MLHYNRIDLIEGIDNDKNYNSKERTVSCYGILIMGLNFKILFAVVVMI